MRTQHHLANQIKNSALEKLTAMTLNVEPQPHSVELSEFSILPTVTTAESMGAIDRETMLCSEVTLQNIIQPSERNRVWLQNDRNYLKSSSQQSYAHHARH